MLFDDVVDVAPEAPAARHGKEERMAKKDEIPAYLRKSRRMRRLLIVVVVLLVLLIAALGYFTFKLIEESQMLATQQAQELKSVEEVDALQDDDAKDAETQAVKKTEAPELTALLGLTQDQAVEALQRGATVTSSREVNEEGNPSSRLPRWRSRPSPPTTAPARPRSIWAWTRRGPLSRQGIRLRWPRSAMATSASRKR